MLTTRKPQRNVHADKVHEMKSGRRILGVSNSWARNADEALEQILVQSPDLRHVSIEVPKADRYVHRLFHSKDGSDWQQVHLGQFSERHFDVASIVRGAQELDGDPAFTSDLSLNSLWLREIAGQMLRPRTLLGRREEGPHGSLAGLIDAKLRKILDYAGTLYIEGAKSEHNQQGRRQSLVTIERLIRHLRASLPGPKTFVFPEPVTLKHSIEGALLDFLAARHVPFLSKPDLLYRGFDDLPKATKKQIAKEVWADAARMPHDTRFDAVYGALLRQAEGHPVYGDRDYERLEAMLAEDLAAGYRVARLDGRLFIHSDGRWRPAQAAPVQGAAEWRTGTIISRNYGRVIVPPHRRDGDLVPGYTRNGPGEGPSLPREAPVNMRCIDRPLDDSNLNWLHAYHAWELEQHTG